MSTSASWEALSTIMGDAEPRPRFSKVAERGGVYLDQRRRRGGNRRTRQLCKKDVRPRFIAAFYSVERRPKRKGQAICSKKRS